MFHTILIANRGEIACRVIRTARRMGIRTVAVYSEADAGALHTTLADIAIPIGPAPARDSYLDGARIIEAALRNGAEAVHPGYGFLSENAGFAEACAAAGLVFIGPPAAAIRAMGSKSAAKSLMQAANVPLVPGYHGADQDPAHLAAEADRVGYPVLIKASAGGGGKGMRVVTAPADFAEALDLARGEALSAFADDQVLVERYLTRPRHIEIQVFADTHGHTISLFERDCSVQRRHQKVVEEAPAPGMTPERRAAMGQAAIEAARAIGYVGAGTVEFISEGDDFFFMEMNTRLQVEHPVTEMVTGLDLVEWQLRVAAGQPLPPAPAAPQGHAIEMRLYAEDPARDFIPATGRLTHLVAPAETAHVRVDTGVRAGDAITIHYDPMIAKLIVWDDTREAALRRLNRALAEYEVAGLTTNIGLLQRIAAHPEFARGAVDTGFIPRNEAGLLAPAATPALAFAAAAAHILRRPAPGHISPWSRPGAWRLNHPGHQDIILDDHGSPRTIRATEPGTRLMLPGGLTATLTTTLGKAGLLLEGRHHAPTVIAEGASLTVLLDGTPYVLTEIDPLAPPAESAGAAGKVTAPMPGRIVSIAVQPGQEVAKGDVLLVLEAMKVQMRIVAPGPGVVAAIDAEVGALVDGGVELVRFEQAAS